MIIIISIPASDPRQTDEWRSFLCSRIGEEWPHMAVQVLRSNCSDTIVSVYAREASDDVDLNVLGACEDAWSAWLSHRAMRGEALTESEQLGLIRSNVRSVFGDVE